jgi:biotin operon repressor
MPKTHPSEVFRLAPCLTSDELLVLLALADYGARIFPSQAALAAKTRLHRTTVNRALQSLRKKEVVQARGFGKALTYVLDLSQGATPTCSGERQVVSLPATGGVAGSDRDPNYRTNHQPNQGAADAAAGGVEVPSDVEARIRMRDPRADIVAQARVCAKVMVQHGLTFDEASRCWRDLCLGWARTGRSAYDLLNEQVQQLAGARDVRAVLLHRLKGVAA